MVHSHSASKSESILEFKSGLDDIIQFQTEIATTTLSGWNTNKGVQHTRCRSSSST
jgi:hypothetical protein